MSTEESVTVDRREWEAVLARLAAVEGRLDGEQSAEPPSERTTHGPARDLPSPRTSARVSRRRALAGLAGAAAAGVAAVAASPDPAAAADGNNIVIGQAQNTGTQTTGLKVTGDDGSAGFGVWDNVVVELPAEPAVFGHANGGKFFCGVLGYGQSDALGVSARSETGVGAVASSGGGVGAIVTTNSASSPALIVTDTGSPGAITINGAYAHLLLQSPNTVQPPARARVANQGAITATVDASLWYCIGTGNPGTWRKLSGPGTAGALHVLPAPKRIYDSRPGTQPAVGSKAPLQPSTPRVLDLKVNSSGVPAGATAALLTVLLVNAAAGNGNLTVWANGVAKPSANTMVWGPAGGRFTATAVSALSSGAGIQVEASLTTDLVIDVVGYYR